MNFALRCLWLIIGFLSVIAIGQAVYIKKYMNEITAENDYESVSVAQLRKDLDCMAINIYREGGYEPIEGRIAIAQVTMNRVAHPDFPNDVCGVVYQKSKVSNKVICQFSWYCDRTHRNRPINEKAYNESYEVAKKVILEGFRLESLEEALYYHANYVRPRWRLERIGQIGTHIFYKQYGGDHQRLAGI